MTKHEIYNGLLAITKARQETCKSEAASMGKDHPTERGALQLSAGIYNVAIAAGLISGTDQAADLMSKRFRTLIKHFPDLAAYYNDLPENEKGIMEVSLYPELFMRVNFHKTYHTDLVEAEKMAILKRYLRRELKSRSWMRFWKCGVLSEWRTICSPMFLKRRYNYGKLAVL